MTFIKKYTVDMILPHPWWFVSLGCMFLLSCASSNTRELQNNYAPTAKLILNQDLTIPAHKTGVFIQGGVVISASARDQYHANCRLIVKDLKTTPQIVKAGQFDITHIQFDEDYVSSTMPLYASTSTHRYIMVSDGPSPQNYATEIYLSSMEQPNVTKLVCSHWEDPTLANHLTPSQIRTTLGDIITLK